jgi:hypothetical protein
MITTKPPSNAGTLFAGAFGGANLATATMKALQEFGKIAKTNTKADQYLKNVFQNYWLGVAQVQQLLHDKHINPAQAGDMISGWNDARDSAIIGYKDIKMAVTDAATNAAMQAFIAIVGAALNAAIKAAL